MSGEAGAPAPRCHIHIGPEPIDPAVEYDRACTPGAGALVQFLGTVRDQNRGAQVVGLEYEAYTDMARTTIRQIVTETHARAPMDFAGAVHRTGPLRVGDVAVCVTVSAGHRPEAFLACRTIIDQLKARAPIWKRETLQSGERRWIEEHTPPTDPEATA